jgi:hypothetical protein
MSEDSFTEITNESWIGRIGGAIKGVLVGFALFIVAFPVLFWNEGRAVKRYKTLNEGAGSVISLPEARVLPENEGKLIHVTGKAVTEEIVTDSEFGVAVTAIKLKRKVEMYQWKENKKRKTKKKIGGGKQTVTTYSYSKSWSSSLIDSSNFKKPDGHENPGSMPYHSTDFVAEEVTVGEFELPPSLIAKINKSAVLPVADLANIDHIPNADFHGGGIYVGDNPASPQIGDARITYHIIVASDVSIVSRQIEQSFEPYRAEAGGTINMLQPGLVGADNMFQQAHRSNAMWTWIFRAGGFIAMLIGVAMILRPLSVVADVIPFIGNIVGAGTGILSFLIAAPLSFSTIAIAWLRYRPVIGIAALVLIAVIAGLIFVLLKRSKTKKKSSQTGTAERALPAQPGLSASGAAAAAGVETASQSEKSQAVQKNVVEMLKQGQHLYQTGQYGKAVAQFSQVIKSGGDKKSALFNRGVALFKLNKKDDAVRDFKFAAKLGHEKAKAILTQIKPEIL